MIICIDPGHTRGWNSPPCYSQYSEGTQMYKLACYLKTALESYGIYTKLTRDDTSDPTLEERGNMASGCDMFISLHSNAVGDGKSFSTNNSVMGIMSYQHPDSKELGDKICEVTAQLLKSADASTISTGVGTGHCANGDKQDWYGVIRHSAPHVKYTYLIEHGFHTNAKQVQWLNNDNNLLALANSEAKVIADYFGFYNTSTSTNSSTTYIPSKSPAAITKSYVYRVTVDPKSSLNIRTGPSESFTKCGTYINGDVITCLETMTVNDNELWGKNANNNWFCIQSSTGEVFAVKDESVTVSAPTSTGTSVVTENTKLNQISGLYIMGDSITRGWSSYTTKYFKAHQIIAQSAVNITMPTSSLHWANVDNVYNNGNDGNTYMGIIKSLSPKYLCLAFGMNDNSAKPENVQSSYETMISKIKSVVPDVKIVIVSITPAGKSISGGMNANHSNIVSINNQLKSFATNNGYGWIDAHSKLVGSDGYLPSSCTIDGIHLSANGYEKYWEAYNGLNMASIGITIGSSEVAVGTPDSTTAASMLTYCLSRESMNVRSSPSTKANIVSNKPKDTIVEFSEIVSGSDGGGKWGKLSDNTGYISIVGKSGTVYCTELTVYTTNTSTNTGDDYSVTTDGSNLNIRSKPSTSEPIVGKLANGEKVKISETTVVGEDDVWGKLADGRGWVAIKYNGEYLMSMLGSSSIVMSEREAEQIYTRDELYGEKWEAMIQDTLNDSTGYVSEDISGLGDFYTNIYKKSIDELGAIKGGTTRLFGLPFQFTKDVDPRVSTAHESNFTNDFGLGRNFADTIVKESPLVYIMPGKCDFLSGSSKDTKKGWINVLADYAETGDLKDALMNLLSGSDQDLVRYYDFDPDLDSYWDKVNFLCRICASYTPAPSPTNSEQMISDLQVPWSNTNIRFAQYDWRYCTFDDIYKNVQYVAGKANNNFFSNVAGWISTVQDEVFTDYSFDNRWLQFYVDAGASYSESVSNTLGDSALSQYTDTVSSFGRELQTVTGMTGLDISGLASDISSGIDSVIQGITSSGGAIGTFLQRLTSNANQVLEGANFLIPQVWQDSSFSKSYNFSVTLSSPYGNPISYYMHILVPLLHLLALALPTQSTANTFKTPPLVRVFSPGWFSCEMGMIDSMSIDKGSDSGWSVSNLPTEIKVSIGVRDMYSSLAIPTNDNKTIDYSYKNILFMSNTGLMEYLLVSVGADLSNMSLSNKVDLILNTTINKFMSNKVSWFGKLQSKLTGLFQSFSNF